MKTECKERQETDSTKQQKAAEPGISSTEEEGVTPEGHEELGQGHEDKEESMDEDAHNALLRSMWKPKHISLGKHVPGNKL